jgi:hypothetical protein
MSAPFDYHPDLDADRLALVVKTIVEIRNSVLRDMSALLAKKFPFACTKEVPLQEEADFDAWWSVACVAYQLTRAALKALEREHPWLTVRYEGLAFTIHIGSVPMRLGYYERQIRAPLASELKALEEMRQAWLPHVEGELERAVLRLELDADRFAPVRRVRLRLVDGEAKATLRSWALYSPEVAPVADVSRPAASVPAAARPRRKGKLDGGTSSGTG